MDTFTELVSIPELVQICHVVHNKILKEMLLRLLIRKCRDENITSFDNSIRKEIREVYAQIYDPKLLTFFEQLSHLSNNAEVHAQVIDSIAATYENHPKSILHHQLLDLSIKLKDECQNLNLLECNQEEGGKNQGLIVTKDPSTQLIRKMLQSQNGEQGQSDTITTSDTEALTDAPNDRYKHDQPKDVDKVELLVIKIESNN